MFGDFAVIFLSIFIEATPFILLGVLLSSIIQVYVSEETMKRLIPRSTAGGLLTAGLVGLVFPVCECGIIPITRRLIKKGVPPHVAVTFMLAVPIINPVVLFSTYYAFSGDLGFVFLRAALGLIVSAGIGYVVFRVYGPDRPVLQEESGGAAAFAAKQAACCENETAACGCPAVDTPVPHKPGFSPLQVTGCGCQDKTAAAVERTAAGRVGDVFRHAAVEFFFVGRFLIVGAILASLTHVFLPRSIVLSIGEGPVSSVLAMMGFAFLISLCSEADAFIAATFIQSFTVPSIVAFMVFGPMLDIKNLIMMGAVFKKRFLLLLVGLIILFVFAGAMYLHWLIF